MTALVHSERPGDDVLRPSVLVAVGILIVNDHVLKIAGPGWVTGKLSDAVGLYAAPFVVSAVIAVVAWLAGRPRPRHDRALATSALFVVTVFAVTKLVPDVASAMGWTLGWIQALPTNVLGLLPSGAVAVQAAPIVADPTDLLMLPAAALAVLVGSEGRRPLRRQPRPSAFSTRSATSCRPLASSGLRTTAQTARNSAVRIGQIG